MDAEFLETFSVLITNVIKESKISEMDEINEWLVKVLEYNVPNGKLNRGLALIHTYRLLTKSMDQENKKLSYILGWCMEILQAGFLIGDDIMDGSKTRRGSPCWYKVDNMGVAAFNDTILLENFIYQVLKSYFRNEPYYMDLVEIFHETVLKTAYGQSLDIKTSVDADCDKFTLNLYKKIVKYKTSYYSFFTPIKLAMIMAGKTDTKLLSDVEKLCFEIGYLFQVQDDYLDCFGNFEVTGKIGTDIQDGKCTWLFVKAMENADVHEKSVLKKLYEAREVEEVKKMYEKLKVVEAYLDFEKQMRSHILCKIEALPEIQLHQIFLNLTEKIYRRKK